MSKLLARAPGFWRAGGPRAGFWLRMVPPHLVRRVAAAFDGAIAECLRDTVGARGARDDARWLRALRQAT